MTRHELHFRLFNFFFPFMTILWGVVLHKLLEKILFYSLWYKFCFREVQFPLGTALIQGIAVVAVLRVIYVEVSSSSMGGGRAGILLSYQKRLKFDEK